MLFRLSALLPVAALAAVVAAGSQCNTGQESCCNATYQTNDPVITELLGTLGIALPSVSGLVGVTCSPITGVGTGSGGSCTQQPVCCTDNQYNGVVNFGCSPITIIV